MKIAAFVAVMLLTVARLSAASNDTGRESRRPWQWTNEERAAARRDPAKRNERVRAFAASHPGRSGALPLDVLDATRNPELFFPTELFESLVRSAFVLLPKDYPIVVRQRSSDLFRDSVEWERFAKLVSDYSEVLKQEHAAAQAIDAAGVSRVQDAKCAASARALREARATFGRERFDRMLYETAGMTRVYGINSDLEESTARAVERAERCQ